MKNPTPWALAIRAHRLSAGLRRVQLAEALRVQPSTVGAWERGKTIPSVGARAKLRALAGAETDEAFLALGEGADPDATLPSTVGRPKNDPGVPFAGRALKLWRVAASHTQATLAAETGIPTSTLCEWELGHRAPTPGGLAKVAEALGREVEDFAVEPTLSPGGRS